MIPQRVIGFGLVVLSLAYLWLFVPRGWVPHDEGMIGQSAERVLAGGVPHVDYEEPYTGGLSWLHAAVFRLVGIDLLYLRWVLFAGASLAQLLTYLILRRYTSPVGAGVGSWLALTWSFPNYFAALPSWWVLICALGASWGFIRHVETGRLRYAAIAGMTAGVAVIVKQTGIYLVVALAMALLYRGSSDRDAALVSRPGRALCAGVALAALVLALFILRSRLALSELLCLLLPIAACSRILLTSDAGAAALGFRNALRPSVVAMACAAVPFTLFVVPYVARQELESLINGLVVLPQRRLQFASFAMPSADFLLSGIPLIAAVMPLPRAVSISTPAGRAVTVSLCALATALAVASLYNNVAYQVIWQAGRAFAALLPVAASSLLLSARIKEAGQRRILLGLTSMLAWASLVQFPFSAPIYFCYVTPLAVVAAASTAHSGSTIGRPAVAACVALLLAFAVLSMNRGYIYNLGSHHAPQALDADLYLRRAQLRVDGRDAITYARVVELVERFANDGQLIAGPDCPEVYFLTGRFSPSGALFDFFSGDASGGNAPTRLTDWSAARVIVLNHRASFSPAPPDHVVAEIRKVYPYTESAGPFEVRWR